MMASYRALHESPFRFLEGGDLLGLVLDRADLLEHDALCVALVCRPFRDRIFEHRARGPPCGGPRLTTRARSLGLSVSRLVWARALARPPMWLERWNAETCRVLAHVGSKVGLIWALEGGLRFKIWPSA